MPYSDRQLAHLSTMGLVAWVERSGVQVSPEHAHGDGAQELAGESGTAPAPPTRGPDAPTADVERRVASGAPEAGPTSAGTIDLGPPEAGPTDPRPLEHDPVVSAAGEPESPSFEPDVPDASVPDRSAPITPTSARPGAGPADTGSAPLDAAPGFTSALNPGAAPGSGSTLDPGPRPSLADATTAVSPPALPMPMPREPSVLATWLPSQPLAPFAYRELTLTRVGREDAPLLIVVERGAPAGGLPLVDAAAELFERMLRAIGMARRDTRQCVLSAEPSPAEADTVGAFALAPYRAALVLMQELDGELDGSACRFLLGEGAAAHPGWCLPHPDLLLVEPRRKAQAWQALKALRRHLETAA